MAIHDILGLAGVSIVLLLHLLCNLGKLTSAGDVYTLCFDWNRSAFVIEAAWVVISLVGFVRVRRGRLRAPG